MKLEIINEFDNKLLKRKEVEVCIQADSNPGFDLVKKEMAGKFKASEDTVVVRGVRSSFGKCKFDVDAFIYSSKEDKEKTEPKKKAPKKAGN
tara:strand:+ start:3747 stop:4022 length:276 start_codon:yes stop_codon:yes gene_type:complete